MNELRQPDPLEHRRASVRLVVETWAILLGLEGLALALHDTTTALGHVACVVTVIAIGCWLHRLYTNAHEAIHKKLFPERLRLNDAIGQLLLLPLLIPLPVYRKIHAFHHGHNRRDHATSTLDGVVVRTRPGPLRRAWFTLLWYLGVFLGGYFIHGLVSIVLFLLLPQRIACRISPAFKGWRVQDQARSWVAFGLGLGLHGGVIAIWGSGAWMMMFGYPFLVFAWVYSLLVYIYHYRTSYGPEVRYNVRSVKTTRLFAWWLLNFNQHATHHRLPKTPWYLLPAMKQPLPDRYQANDNVVNVRSAIWQQWKGPTLFEEP